MTIAFSVMIGLALLFFGFWVWSAVAGYLTDKMLSYEEWTDRFFTLASRLLDKDDLPEEWRETISYLSARIDDKIMPRALSHAFDRENRKKFHAESAALSEPVAKFIEHNPDLTRIYVSVTRSAFLAMTFLAPLNIGAEIRARMAEEWERDRPGPNAASKEVATVKKLSQLKLVHSAA